MTNTFVLKFNTDADMFKNFKVNDAKTGLDVSEFNTHVGKIIGSDVLSGADFNVTGIKKGELVTETRQQYV